MSLEFHYARRDEYPRIRAFIDEHWARNHIYVRTPELFDWTFQRPGFWESGSYSFALGEDHGELVGILGGIPYSFNAFGAAKRGVWIVNYAVRPDYRKGAAALRLLSTFRNATFSVVIASGLNHATVAIYRVLHGQVLPETPRHVVVLPGAAARMAQLVRVAHPEFAEARALELGTAFELRQMSEPAGDSSDQLPRDWDAVDWPLLAARTVGATRDAVYLKWRYLDHPCFRYRIIAIRDNDRSGLLIWRLETARQATADGRTDIDRIGRVVEFLPVHAANARKLLAAFLHQLKAADALGADFYGYHGGIRQMLSEACFREAEHHPDGGMIPARLQPVEAGGGMLNAMFADPDLPPCTLQPDCPWYWTKSDSDQDRPN